MVTSHLSLINLIRRYLLFTSGHSFLETLDMQVQHVKQRAFSMGTLQNKYTQIKAYLLFAYYVGFKPVPLTVIAI